MGSTEDMEIGSPERTPANPLPGLEGLLLDLESADRTAIQLEHRTPTPPRPSAPRWDIQPPSPPLQPSAPPMTPAMLQTEAYQAEADKLRRQQAILRQRVEATFEGPQGPIDGVLDQSIALFGEAPRAIRLLGPPAEAQWHSEKLREMFPRTFRTLAAHEALSARLRKLASRRLREAGPR